MPWKMSLDWWHLYISKSDSDFGCQQLRFQAGRNIHARFGKFVTNERLSDFMEFLPIVLTVY